MRRRSNWIGLEESGVLIKVVRDTGAGRQQQIARGRRRIEQAYGIGAGAAFVKYLRCGDLYGARLFATWTWELGVRRVGAGLLMLSAWSEQTPTSLRVAGLVIQGVGLGLFQLAYTDIVTAALPLGDRGVAGSLALLTRTLGTVAAASIVLMVFEILNVGQDFFEAFRQTFQLAALLAFASAALLVFAPRTISKV